MKAEFRFDFHFHVAIFILKFSLYDLWFFLFAYLLMEHFSLIYIYKTLPRQLLCSCYSPRGSRFLFILAIVLHTFPFIFDLNGFCVLPFSPAFLTAATASCAHARFSTAFSPLFGTRGGQEGQKQVPGAHIPLEKLYDNFLSLLAPLIVPDCIENNFGIWSDAAWLGICNMHLTSSFLVLLEAPSRPDRIAQKNSVLLTIDLTRAVVDEAIEKQVSVIVAYRKAALLPLALSFWRIRRRRLYSWLFMFFVAMWTLQIRSYSGRLKPLPWPIRSRSLFWDWLRRGLAWVIFVYLFFIAKPTSTLICPLSILKPGWFSVIYPFPVICYTV